MGIFFYQEIPISPCIQVVVKQTAPFGGYIQRAVFRTNRIAINSKESVEFLYRIVKSETIVEFIGEAYPASIRSYPYGLRPIHQ